MVNRGTRLALGAAGFYQSNGEVGDDGIGVRARLRWWMGRTISLDLAPGMVLHGEGRFGSGPRSEFSGHVGLNLGDYAAVTVHVVERPHAQSGPDVFVGGRVGYAFGALILVCLVALYATATET